MNTINSLAPFSQSPLKPIDTSDISQAKAGFGDILSSTLQSVNSAQIAGDAAIEKLQTGDAKHLHEVMIAVEEADVSLRMLVQMRNKALTAYEEIMRMQI
jgi:flagellar hook-basal body complex protein FliE